MEIRLDALPSDPAALQQVVRALAAELHSREALIDRLKARLATLRRSQYGRSSEKLDRAIEQLELALEDAEATSAARIRPSPPPGEEKVRPARRPLPDHLSREQCRHEASHTCPGCGGRDLLKLGEDGEPLMRHWFKHNGERGARLRAGLVPRRAPCPAALHLPVL